MEEEKVLCVAPAVGIVVSELPRLPAGDNPVLQDAVRKGSHLVRGWIAMHEGYDRLEEPLPLPYLILINTRNGRRIKITLPKN